MSIAPHELRDIAALNALLKKTSKSSRLVIRPHMRPSVATLKIGRFLLVDDAKSAVITSADDLLEIEQRIIEREAA